MAKYRVLSLISFEFIIEVQEMFAKDGNAKIIKRYCEISDISKGIGKSAVIGWTRTLQSSPKVAEFMSRKRAEKWLKNYCARNNLDPLMFELVKEND